MEVEADMWVGRRGSAHVLIGAVSRVHVRNLAFSPHTSEVAVFFFFEFLYLVHNLSQLHIYAVTYSPLRLFIYLLYSLL